MVKRENMGTEPRFNESRYECTSHPTTNVKLCLSHTCDVPLKEGSISSTAAPRSKETENTSVHLTRRKRWSTTATKSSSSEEGGGWKRDKGYGRGSPMIAHGAEGRPNEMNEVRPESTYLWRLPYSTGMGRVCVMYKTGDLRLRLADIKSVTNYPSEKIELSAKTFITKFECECALMGIKSNQFLKVLPFILTDSILSWYYSNLERFHAMRISSCCS